jgi:hypothetical protein
MVYNSMYWYVLVCTGMNWYILVCTGGKPRLGGLTVEDSETALMKDARRSVETRRRRKAN